MSLLLRIAYDGTDFHGYARQKVRADGTAIRTVQGELEAALSVLYRQDVPTRSASRTDAGVHARGQLVSLEPPGAIPPLGLARGLNARLPRDVRVLSAWEDAQDRDVRHDNAGKRYRYVISCEQVQDPCRARFEWHLARALAVEPMREAARHFVGCHDYGSFRAAACQAQTTERTVEAVEVRLEALPWGPAGDPGRLEPHGHHVLIDVRGQAFLHNMVRIMVGTLVEVGLGRRPPAQIRDLLATPDRRRAGMTAPAQGLTLLEVLWPHPAAV